MKLSNYIVILLLLLCTLPAVAQTDSTGTYLRTIPVSSPTAVSVDRNGAVYFLNPRRNLVQLDSLGRAVAVYSPSGSGSIKTVDAWNAMEIMVFYEDQQEILLLDRFFSLITQIPLTDFGLNSTVTAAAVASSDGFWLFDETDFKLSKLDSRLRRLTVETPLNLILDRERFDIRMLREYQNHVYLLDYNAGIYVFDNLGNYKQKIPVTGVQYINFIGNELYFVKEDKLHFTDLYTGKQYTLNLPETKDYQSALVTGNRLYLFRNKTADIFER